MSPSDLLAIAALLVAGLAAFYARGARDAAAKANKITVHESRRPLRLPVFQAMFQFSHYCSTYWTLYHLHAVNKAEDLVGRIDTFKWEIAQHGHLDMPDVEIKVKELISNAWNMQRLIDRIAGGQDEPLNRTYATAEENIEALVEWFASENRELKTLFRPYLAVA
jgi:hypothetical protein